MNNLVFFNLIIMHVPNLVFQANFTSYNLTWLYRTAARDRPKLFVITGVRYNRVELRSKWSFGTGKFDLYN